MTSELKPRRLFATAEPDDSSLSCSSGEELPSSEPVVCCVVKFAQARHSNALLRKIKDSKCRVKIVLPSARRLFLCGDRYDILSVLNGVEHESIVFQKEEN